MPRKLKKIQLSNRRTIETHRDKLKTQNLATLNYLNEALPRLELTGTSARPPLYFHQQSHSMTPGGLPTTQKTMMLKMKLLDSTRKRDAAAGGASGYFSAEA